MIFYNLMGKLVQFLLVLPWGVLAAIAITLIVLGFIFGKAFRMLIWYPWLLYIVLILLHMVFELFKAVVVFRILLVMMDILVIVLIVLALSLFFQKSK